MKWMKRSWVVILMGILSVNLFGFGTFGTFCQEDFQNNWTTTIPSTWTRCGNFNIEMRNSMAQAYYYNMVGAAWLFHTPGSSQSSSGIDAVDLLWASTHGGTWSGPVRSIMTMWNDWVVASSPQMRLGNRLSILATYSCMLLRSDDGNFGTRLRNIWDGGLRIWTGSHNLLYAGSSTNMLEIGRNFARSMRTNSATIKMAWYDAVRRASNSNNIAVAATGRTADECHSRKDNMRLNNYGTYLRLRDNDVRFYCWSTWNSI